MLYQAAVILTYPVMLEKVLTPSALRGPALALQVPGLARGAPGRGTHRRGGGIAEAIAAPRLDTSFTWWQLDLSGAIHQIQGREELGGIATKASSISEGYSIRMYRYTPIRLHRFTHSVSIPTHTTDPKTSLGNLASVAKRGRSI